MDAFGVAAEVAAEPSEGGPFLALFELWNQILHLTACPQPGGGHLRHIPLQPPYRDP